ncbi:MAG: DcrB-related protein [Sterolibacteriaceae bacterium]|nr:DcrB-related protein [Sterolibacteriaceae bacterium]
MQGFVKRQLANLARQVAKYEEEPWQPVSLGDPRRKIDGILLTLRYKQQGRFVFHRQAVFAIPDDQHLLTFTASLPAPFSPAQIQQFMDVLKSFTARR